MWTVLLNASGWRRPIPLIRLRRVRVKECQKSPPLPHFAFVAVRHCMYRSISE
jgi:hypothetical protein